MIVKAQTLHQSAIRLVIHRPAQSSCKEMVRHNTSKQGFLVRQGIISKERLAEPDYLCKTKPILGECK